MPLKRTVEDKETCSTLFYLNNDTNAIPNEIRQVMLYTENDSLWIQPEAICSLHITPIWNDNDFPWQVLNFNNLEYLWIGMRKFETLPSQIVQLQRLQELDIQNSNLKTLPNNIGELKKLEKLSLLLTDVESLPISICQLENLTKLHLGGTKIKTLPECLDMLSQLKELIVFHENEALPQRLIHQLDELKNALPNCKFYLN